MWLQFEIDRGPIGVVWGRCGPVWGSLGLKPAPNRHQRTPTGRVTTSNCSYVCCRHIHRSRKQEANREAECPRRCLVFSKARRFIDLFFVFGAKLGRFWAGFRPRLGPGPLRTVLAYNTMHKSKQCSDNAQQVSTTS